MTKKLSLFNNLNQLWRNPPIRRALRNDAKFNGVKTNFELHLKECEWRYDKSSSLLIQTF